MPNEQPRKPIQDILVPHQEIARRVSPALSSTNVVAPSNDTGMRRIENNPFFKKNIKNKAQQPKSGSRLFWLFAVTGGVLGLFFGVATYFSSAEVKLTPLVKNINLADEFVASADPNSQELGFQLMSFTEEKATEVPATVEKKIQTKASGKVLIYNSYNANSQRLIKNTRLESSDKKIFRIEESVVVPGATISTKLGERDKVLEPGVVEAVIYADVPGKEYDIGLADFTVPGFKNDPRHAKFMARSKPDSPVKGGFLGTVKIPTSPAIIAAQNDLKEELKKSVVEKVRMQIPDTALFFPGSIIMKFEAVPQSFSTNDSTKVSLRALVSVVFFSGDKLTQKIVEKTLPEYRNVSFVAPRGTAISFVFLDGVDDIILTDLKRVRFRLEGQVSLVGEIDVEKLKNLLPGKNEKEFLEIIKNQNNVKKADLVIRPMWKKSFPQEVKKISIKVLLPK